MLDLLFSGLDGFDQLASIGTAGLMVVVIGQLVLALRIVTKLGTNHLHDLRDLMVEQKSILGKIETQLAVIRSLLERW